MLIGNESKHVSTEYYVQWFDERRDVWVTPTKWLHRGGFATLLGAQGEGVEFVRKDSPNVRVRFVHRQTIETVMYA